MPYVGEICALLTAGCWTLSSTAFAVASRAVGPLAANQFRVLAPLPVLAVLTLLVTGEVWPHGASGEQFGWLVGSGFTGLVLGDLGYFYALAKIGPRLCSVVMATWPAFTVGIEAALGRLPTAAMLGGIALTMLGVTTVLLRNREGAQWDPATSRRQMGLGIAGAFVGAAGQAGGFVLAGFGMAPSDGAPAVAPIACTLVRMLTAAIGLQLFLSMQRAPFAMKRVFVHGLALRTAIVGAVFGPIGGVWLSMIARAQAEANGTVGIVSALMGTTPIFMMPLARAVYGARIGALGVLGTVLAVAGVAVCFLARAAR